MNEKQGHIRTPLRDDQLRQYRAAVRSLSMGFEAVQDHVIITDPHGNIIYANQAVEKNTGFALSEVVGEAREISGAARCQKSFTSACGRRSRLTKNPLSLK